MFVVSYAPDGRYIWELEIPKGPGKIVLVEGKDMIRAGQLARSENRNPVMYGFARPYAEGPARGAFDDGIRGWKYAFLGVLLKGNPALGRRLEKALIEKEGRPHVWKFLYLEESEEGGPAAQLSVPPFLDVYSYITPEGVMRLIWEQLILYQLDVQR